MWIEILHAWGHDPVAGLAFTVGTDFGGDQWVMFTYPDEDLRRLYGVEAHELNVWHRLIDHVEEQLDLGCLCAIDVDAYHLPDTAGVTHHLSHQKTTVAVQMLDRSRERLGYFHNAGYAELSGEDFRALFGLGEFADPLADALPPYTLQIRMGDGLGSGPEQLVERTLERLEVHLDRRPVTNPVTRLAKAMGDHVSALAELGMEAFHRYAFGTCRHLGANGQLAAAFVDWLAAHDPRAPRSALAVAATEYTKVSTGAKAAEFMLARAVAGRRVDLAAALAPLEDAWGLATETLAREYAH